ncbi:MAG: AAA family ATPase [Verrucomicrobia bacterium]|nr:AAA family ATPase [Verrucomicrobiota bacterium]
MSDKEKMTSRQTGITSITIENFKGIGASVTIPLRPITLLFGANSAGKSTILQALHYARELLERNNANPDQTLLGGEAIELGGFRNLVHRHDLERTIKIRLDITPTADGIPTLAELLGITETESQEGTYDINDEAATVSIELTARWDHDRNEGWFSACRYWLDGKPAVTLRKSKADSLPAIEYIDFFHPTLVFVDGQLGIAQDEYHQSLLEVRENLAKDLKRQLLEACTTPEPVINIDIVRGTTVEPVIKRGDPITEEAISRLVSAFPDVSMPAVLEGENYLARLEIESALKQFQESEISLKKDHGFYPQIQLQGQTSVSPSTTRPLGFSKDAFGEGQEHYFALINQIVVGITFLARQSLDQFRYIGPIRAIPDRHHEAPQIDEPARWSGGLAAWDLLLRHYDRTTGKEDEFVETVSRWLEDSERLNLGYRIKVTADRQLPEDGMVMTNLRLLLAQYEERSDSQYRQLIWNPLQELPRIPRIRLTDIRTNTEVGPKDIGIGVAQALPIVVAALDSKCRFLAIEQPELHLHPAAQARLGDLFVTQAGDARQFLIETHSETLMLRIFRRIRETTRNKAPRKELEIRQQDIALLYVSANENGTRISEIRLDDQGKFVDPVPGGFFEEGFEELF